MNIKTFTLLFLLSSPLVAVCQSQATTDLAVLTDKLAQLPKVKSTQWQDLQLIGGVMLSYKYEACHDNKNDRHAEMVLFKANNTLGVPVEISFQLVPWFGSQCSNCEGIHEGYKQTVRLESGGEQEGICFKNGMNLFSKFLNMDTPKPLTNFTIRDIAVQTK